MLGPMETISIAVAVYAVVFLAHRAERAIEGGSTER